MRGRDHQVDNGADHRADAIGGLAEGVTPLEMADAYATLADGGVHHPATAIAKVVFPDGHVDRPARASGRRVLTTGEAYEVTRILEQVITKGTGAGFTSIGSLQKLPIDVLKIDRSFVGNMCEDEDATSIVRAILSLASSLGIETTAEGIERAELGDALAEMGCTYGQGYHYARPMPADEAIAYWRERSA